jgi:hypothetical protein
MAQATVGRGGVRVAPVSQDAAVYPTGRPCPNRSYSRETHVVEETEGLEDLLTGVTLTHLGGHHVEELVEVDGAVTVLVDVGCVSLTTMTLTTLTTPKLFSSTHSPNSAPAGHPVQDSLSDFDLINGSATTPLGRGAVRPL